MGGYREYIELGLPPEISADQARHIDKDLQVRIGDVLEEIWSTPDGRDLIIAAGRNSNNGRIYVVATDVIGRTAMGSTDAGETFIAVGGDSSRLRYSTIENDTLVMKDGSLERATVHELLHVAFGHVTFRKNNGPLSELEVTEATNRYMCKYYGEPPRDYFDPNQDLNGEPEFERSEFGLAEGAGLLTPNFEELRQALSSMTFQDIEGLGPEVESLWEFRHSPVHFARQYDEVLATAPGYLRVQQALEQVGTTCTPKSHQPSLDQDHESSVNQSISLPAP
ncbi:MAG TPA: hypothetical protein PLK85_02250 [Alphaproteobacteria bacterium]|nr:hypothetical protein [Alphaproteobacteria bacterium]